MSLLSAIFYGFIQGLAEFLPISSSGHLALAQAFFGQGEPNMSFNVLLHIATLAAVFIVFYKDVFPLIPAFFRLVGKWLHGKFRISYYDNDEKMVLFVIISTLPLLPTALIDNYIEKLNTFPKVVGVMLVFNGLMLFFSDRISKGKKDIGDMTLLDSIAVGMFQLLAVLPGVSRSGSTITGGRLRGFSREFAVKYSFILSIPAIIGAGVLEVPDLVKEGIPAGETGIYAAGMITALITGVLAMKLLTYISRKSNFSVFSAYCIAVGTAAIVFA